jgi:hypothetical protein
LPCPRTVVKYERVQKLTSFSIAIIGNTTCPSSQLAMTSSHVNAVEFLLEKYGNSVFPFQMCPLPLFIEIIKINHLRRRATRYDTNEAESLSDEAYTILECVDSFSPEKWAVSKPSSQAEWLLVGKVYQAAAALYCILSLQSLSVLPATPALRARCTAHGQLLHVLLKEGLSSPKINRVMIWPLVLLGVEAVHSGTAMRDFVAKHLPELSRVVGTSVPLTAKRVLELFWVSGETSWDACFDRPYAFTTQIAVDISHLLPAY